MKIGKIVITKATSEGDPGLSKYKPPFQITSAILQAVADICEMVGRWSVSAQAVSPILREQTINIGNKGTQPFMVYNDVISIVCLA